MEHNTFMLSRIDLLNQVTRGFGDSICESAIFAELRDKSVSTEEFKILIEWGVLTGFLQILPSISGRRYRIDRKVMAEWRQRANGENPQRRISRPMHWPPIAPQ